MDAPVVPDGTSGGPSVRAASPEPVIVGFLCHWCAYRAADAAGTAREAYAAALRPLQVTCSGRVDAGMVLEAFAGGADGVLVVGCHPGSCHFVDGNLKALRRHALLGRLLAQLGVEPERLGLLWVSAAEGAALAAAVDAMARRLRALGPLHPPGGREPRGGPRPGAGRERG